jgi:hypothetical protein
LLQAITAVASLFLRQHRPGAVIGNCFVIN